MPEEETLAGGLVDKVVRVGDTVRRPTGPWTPNTQALLRHLSSRGFPCPVPQGTDSQGREILSYLAGQPIFGSMHELLDEQGCFDLGRLVQTMHELSSDFEPLDPPVWQAGIRTRLAGEVILHGDLGPTNLLFEAGRVVGVIDWDLAYPG